MLKTIKRNRQYLRHLRGRIGLATALVLVSPILGVVSLQVVSQLTDIVFVKRQVSALPAILGAYALTMMMRAFVDFARSSNDSFITESIGMKARSAVIARALQQPAKPGSARRTGEILGLASSDAERIEQLIYSLPLSVVSNIFTISLYVFFLFALSPKLTLCALLIGPALGVLSAIAARRSKRLARLARRRRDAWMSFAEERLNCLPHVQIFGMAKAEALRFDRLSGKAMLTDVSIARRGARLTAQSELVQTVGALLVICIGGLEASSGNLSVGALIAFIGSVGSVYSPVKSLAKSVGRIQRAKVAEERLNGFLSEEAPVAEPQNPRLVSQGPSSLRFDSVTFGYGASGVALDEVSFEVKTGEVLAIVGPNGAGKSTIAQLVSRLYDPISGAIRIGGTDIRSLSLSDLRSEVTVLSQEAVLLRGSVRENIRFGTPDASLASIYDAGRLAQVDSFLASHPGRYEAIVEAKGRNFSGGQRQRIAFARALLRKSRFLILDEANSALDAETDELLGQQIRILAQSRAIILITHRLNSVLLADRVLVLDQGRIVEEGSPSHLLSSGERFKRLFDAEISNQRAAA